MKLNDFFNYAIKCGIDKDPRGKKFITKELKRRKEDFEKLKDPKKIKKFDKDTLKNPYDDTRLLSGDNIEIKSVMVGIDIDNSEILLADRLREKGQQIDLVISHHPAGRAHANFYKVMSMQADMLANLGVPINQAEGALNARMDDISRSVSPANHNRVVNTAGLLNIPLCCIHTPADNHVHNYLTQLVAKEDPYRLEDMIELLEGVYEYQEAGKLNSGPSLFLGSNKNRCGKIAFEMTGGTSGSEEAIKQMADAGIGTLVVMHIPEGHRKSCKKYHINIVCAGHISSDSLGLNLLMANIKRSSKEDFKIIPISGYTYFKR